jgi:hypothetical protein
MERREERRHSVRVLADCPAIYRVIDPDGPKRIEEKRSGLYHIPSLPHFDTAEKLYKKLHGQGTQNSDPDVMEMLLWMDWKISFMIKTLPHSNDEEVFPNRGMVKNLSGEGFAVQTIDAPKLGALLEFEIILPIIPFREMFLKGEVVWFNHISDTASYNYEVGFSFRDISESDHEHIIAYVVKRQLQVQRERRK